MSRRRGDTSGCPIDMTPMIDVVFQLIIFFIVTIKMDQNTDPDIYLEDGKHGPIIEEQDARTMVVEINRFGWIKMSAAQLTRKQFADIMTGRLRRIGQFPVLIRADARTKHEDVRAVMDICSGAGIGQVSFAAVKDRKVHR